VHVRPILCFADCAPMLGPSPTWAAIGAITLTTSGLFILWSSKRHPKAKHARSFRQRHPLLIGIGLGVSVIVAMIWWRFQSDIEAAHARVSHGSVLIETACGPIEYQEAGTGIPLLSVHGSGGGFDQGMAFAAPLATQGIRVIAMSRFGYLRTPMPTNASAEAQADAHVCLLDALGIGQAAVMGGSAGAPSALQMAIRHPDRVSALILLVPLAYKPPKSMGSAPPLSPWVENLMMQVIGSDFLFWTASHIARNQMIKVVLATPPELLDSASPAEQARVNAMLNTILPVSARAAGLRSDSAVGKNLKAAALDKVRAPTLIISARDDGYGTYASAEYTASQITCAKFIGFDTGGHTWVGHNDEVMIAILELLLPKKQQ
jgi:2-hydroxy-6-oxonona-2,4-dienedioate hydrolase